MMVKKTPITDIMTKTENGITITDIMADMANDDCAHIRWLDALWTVLVMFGAYSLSFDE